MNIAVIDKKDITIKVDRSSVKFSGGTLPLKLMDILIINHRVNLTSSDILKLNANNTILLIVSYDNKNISMLNSANTKRGDLELAQFNALSNRLNLAKYFVSQKIISHAKMLEKLDVNLDISSQIGEIINCSDLNTLLSIEGKVAKAYFKKYFALFPKRIQPKTRTKNPPKDVVNALMSFWYSLFYNIITVKLLSYGFNPAIGYLHTPFRSHNALSSDLLELFRADINMEILQIFNKKLLEKEDFTNNKGGVYLKYSGRQKIWENFVNLVAKLEPKLKQEIATLRAKINHNENE